MKITTRRGGVEMKKKIIIIMCDSAETVLSCPIIPPFAIKGKRNSEWLQKSSNGNLVR